MCVYIYTNTTTCIHVCVFLYTVHVNTMYTYPADGHAASRTKSSALAGRPPPGTLQCEPQSKGVLTTQRLHEAVSINWGSLTKGLSLQM